MNTDNLVKRFKEAGLELVIAREPLNADRNRTLMMRRRGTPPPVVEIIQLDIRRKFKGNARSEYFILWPGHESNVVMVQGIDKDRDQLVLLLQEPEREFVETANSWVVKDYNAIGKAAFCRRFNLSERNVWVENGELKIKRKTPKGVRHFLAGRDERQLFMCQLPRPCTTVQQAHDCLKTPEVYTAEGKVGRAVRQGEWFFLMPSKEEQESIAQAIKKKMANIRTKIAIGSLFGQRGGKPHTADEAMTLPAPKLEHGWAVRTRPEIFVRGKIRHADHATVEFSSWRKVMRNNEPRSSGGDFGSVSVGGGTWID